MSLRSIFDLPTSKDQLESVNNGMAGYKYLQKAPLRNIVDEGTNQRFNNGVITYRFDMASSSYWLPSKSFFRLRCQLTKADNVTPLDTLDGIAPSMGMVGNLFNECSATINDQQISVANRHIGEIESIYTRLNQSGQWLRDTGQQVNMWEADLNKRIQTVSSNGFTGDVVGGDPTLPEIINKLNISQIDSTTTIIIAAATHIATFTNIVGGTVEPIFQKGDIIVLKLTAEFFSRAFYVVDLLNGAPLTVQLASTGRTLAGDVGPTAAFDIQIYRYCDVDSLGMHTFMNENQTSTVSAIVTTGVYSLLGGTDENNTAIKNGDVLLWAQNLTTLYNGLLHIRKTDRTTGIGASYNPNTVLTADVDNRVYGLRYNNLKIEQGGDLGYLQNTQNGHAVIVNPSATGSSILTITKVAAGAADIPDVNDNFQLGDIVVIQILTAGAVTRYGLIIEVDPSSNKRSLRIIGTDDLGAAFGSVGDGRDYLLQRIRYNAKNSNKVSQVARQVKEFSLIWRPSCLSLFRIPHALPGGAKFEVLLTPKNLYREAAIESLVGKKAGTDYNFQVKSMFLYVPVFEGKPHIDKFEFYLDLNEIRCQKADITSKESSYSLDVRPSTNALAIAIQSSQVDNDTNFSSSKFLGNDSIHLKMNRFHVRYSGEQKAIPSFDMAFNKASNKDLWTEIYARNILNTGGYFESQETMDEFLNKRGPYIYSLWPRSADDRETRVYITVGFDDTASIGGDNTTQKLLLFNMYKKYAICRLDNGRWNEILISES